MIIVAKQILSLKRGVKSRGRIKFNVVIDTLGADTTSYIDTVPGTGDFSYRVKVINSVNEVTSDIVKVTVVSTTDPEPAPEPVTILAPSNLVAVKNEKWQYD